ncbi:LamG domain-containing protein [Candidatus Pacearchaeota archaeon]|nr:LamG domain-containing protein [Candidatus Pacearchaeota archaeon]
MSKRIDQNELLERKNYQIFESQNKDDIENNIESEGYLLEHVKDKNRIIPYVDFSELKNFCFYGSGEKYYKDSITNIYQNYPFDGSKKDKLQWRNNSSYFDNYVFDYLYPKSTGFAIFSSDGWGVQESSSSYTSGTIVGGFFGEPSTKEYILIKGGPNTGSLNNSYSFDKSNIYDAEYNRLSNLYLSFEDGNTVEFWMKKPIVSLGSGSSMIEYIFDLYNNETIDSSAYGRYSIALVSEFNIVPWGVPDEDEVPTFMVNAVSGSDMFFTSLGSGSNILIKKSEIYDNEWHHYAFSSIVNEANFYIDVYYDGEYKGRETITTGIPSGTVSGAMIATIGSTVGQIVEEEMPRSSARGWCKLSASIDEFRYWKSLRTGDQIGKNWFRNVNGGSNTDDANTELGVYYKFNEGVLGSSSYDCKVLDYSGRISDGFWYGYLSAGRSTGSSINDSGYFDVDEEEDPIMYSNHSDVVDLLAEKEAEGKEYDINNISSMYHLLPAWILEEDQDKDRKTILELMQVISNYFDSLHLQIGHVQKIKDLNYIQDYEKPFPYSKKLVEDLGMVAPEMFIDGKLTEELSVIRDNNSLQENISNVKNYIYQNIYNNLSNIYKKKGTEDSFRNLIRCFGIDDELIKLNVYSNDNVFTFEDKYSYTSRRKKYIDFNDIDRKEGVVYSSGTFGYCLASKYDDLVYEVDVIFPKKFNITSTLFRNYTSITSSIGGIFFKSGTFAVEENKWNIYTVREEEEGSSAQFILTSSDFGGYGFNLTSSYYHNLYDNERWILSAKLLRETPELYDRASSEPNYKIVFCGVNTLGDETINSFEVSSSLDKSITGSFDSIPFIPYIGACRTNVTGTALVYSDVKVGSLRIYKSDLSLDTMKAHSRDPYNYGVKYPTRFPYFNRITTGKQFLPEEESLALFWDFQTITTSDSLGVFDVLDVSSGTINLDQTTPINQSAFNYQWSVPGYGEFFPEDDDQVVNIEYIHTAKQEVPDTVFKSNSVKILEKDDYYFKRDAQPISYFYMFEKNMYQNISEEMLNMFATLSEFDNIVGSPVNRYRMNYKDLEFLRRVFFKKRIKNIPSFEKFVEFYKWIDTSLDIMLQQLIPASSDFADGIKNIVESHVLERNKYWNKFPTIEFKSGIIQNNIRGIAELLYNWKTGHAPVSGLETDNCFWWKERSEDGTVRDDYRTIITRNVAGSTYATRRLSKIYDLKTEVSKILHGGKNPTYLNKKSNFIRNLCVGGVRNNKYQTNLDFSKEAYCDDLNERESLKGTIKLTGEDNNTVLSGDSYEDTLKHDFMFPLTFLYNNGSTDKTQDPDYIILETNDSYVDNEIPLQGTFTNQHVGGFRHKHLHVNVGTDDALSREEMFHYYKSGNDYIIQDVSDDNIHRPADRYYRGDMIKRFVNIENILTTTSSFVGNYENNYEILQTCGVKEHNLWFKDITNAVCDIYGISTENVLNAFSSIYFDIIHTNLSSLTGTCVSLKSYLQSVNPEYMPNKRSIIFNRFSAPGDIYTIPERSLDLNYLEYSPYNAMPWRNMKVIDALDKDLSKPCGSDGYFLS